MVKNLPAVQETWVWSLGGEDPLEKGMTSVFSVLAWRIPWTEEPVRLQFLGSQRVGHDWVTNTLLKEQVSDMGKTWIQVLWLWVLSIPPICSHRTLLIGAIIIYLCVGPTFLCNCFHLHQIVPASLRDYLKGDSRYFPVVQWLSKTPHSQCRGLGSTPGWGATCSMPQLRPSRAK